MHIKDLVAESHRIAKAHGWHSPSPSFGEMVALAHSELSEALEAYRKLGMTNYTGDDGKPEGVASELADTVIRIADMCGALGIDLESAIAWKQSFNEKRPYRHGGKSL